MKKLQRAKWIIGVVLGLMLWSGCSLSATTDHEPYQPAVGSNARTEQVDAFGVALVVDGEGNGRVVGTLINTEDSAHALTGASIKVRGRPVRAALLADVIRLPPDVPVELADAPPVSVAAHGLIVGSFVDLTLDVTDGALVQMLIPVEASKGPYGDVDVVAVPGGRPVRSRGQRNNP